jgi:hypothetical protein
VRGDVARLRELATRGPGVLREPLTDRNALRIVLAG